MLHCNSQLTILSSLLSALQECNPLCVLIISLYFSGAIIYPESDTKLTHYFIHELGFYIVSVAIVTLEIL